MTQATQLIAEVKAVGADTTESQMLAVSAASDAAAAGMASLGDVMKAAGLEFFTFDDASKSFVSNMAQASEETLAATASTDAWRSATEMAAMTAEGMAEATKQASAALLST